MWLTLIPMTVCLFFLIRTVLMMSGFLKGPILATFEKYGDAETVYYPMPPLIMWSGFFVLSIGPWIAPALGSWSPIVVSVALMFLGAYLAYNNPDFALKYPHIFMSYPRWYFELRERTSRYERRRIAYMWLSLPPRLRLAYNGSDHAFNQWADLVIMATMRYDEDSTLLRDQSPSNGYY